LNSGRYIVRFSICRLPIFYLFLILPNGDVGKPTQAGNFACFGIKWIVWIIHPAIRVPDGKSGTAMGHSYATHLVENGIDVTFVQELLGHIDVRTTLCYMYVGQKKINLVESPLNRAFCKSEEPKNEEEKPI